MDGEQFEEYMRRIDEEEDEQRKEDLANEMLSQLAEENTIVMKSASSAKSGTTDFAIQMIETASRAKEAMDHCEAFVLFSKKVDDEEDKVVWKTFLAGASADDYFSLTLCCKTMLEMLAETLRTTEDDDDAIT